MPLTTTPGKTTITTILATLAGAAAAFEGAPIVTIAPAAAASAIRVAPDNLSFEVDWAADAVGDEVITVEVDNIQGTVQGHLQATDTVTIAAPGDVIIADAIALSTTEKPAA